MKKDNRVPMTFKVSPKLARKIRSEAKKRKEKISELHEEIVWDGFSYRELRTPHKLIMDHTSQSPT